MVARGNLTAVLGAAHGEVVCEELHAWERVAARWRLGSTMGACQHEGELVRWSVTSSGQQWSWAELKERID